MKFINAEYVTSLEVGTFKGKEVFRRLWSMSLDRLANAYAKNSWSEKTVKSMDQTGETLLWCYFKGLTALPANPLNCGL